MRNFCSATCCFGLVHSLKHTIIFLWKPMLERWGERRVRKVKIQLAQSLCPQFGYDVNAVSFWQPLSFQLSLSPTVLLGYYFVVRHFTLSLCLLYTTAIFVCPSLCVSICLGTVPPNLRWGDGACISPSNILRSSVIGCVRKYELSKKRCRQGIVFQK